MLKSLMENVIDVSEQMGNVIRKIKTLSKRIKSK